jgi:hypothetical protein
MEPISISPSSGEIEHGKSSNRELAERLVKCAPEDWGAWIYAVRVEFTLGFETRRWHFDRPDTYPGNGDFCAWVKSEIAKRGLWVETHVGGGFVSATISDVNHARVNGFGDTEAAALVACLCEVLEASTSPLAVNQPEPTTQKEVPE